VSRARLFPADPGDRPRGNRHNVTCGRFPLSIRKHFFTERVTKRWHKLPGEVVESPSTEILKSRLNVVLGSLSVRA